MRKRRIKASSKFKERPVFSAIADISPQKLSTWEWSPGDIAMHEMTLSKAAAPMHAMFDLLQNGEVQTIKGKPVMEMPAGYGTVEYGEWVEIRPALERWIDCMERLDDKLPNRALKQLSRYLDAGIPLTQKLVTDARAEFDSHLQRMRSMLPIEIKSAATTAQIIWELERIQKEAA